MNKPSPSKKSGGNAPKPRLMEGIAAFVLEAAGKMFSRQESVVFISLHKCATSYFSKNVLRQLKGRNLIDFQQRHYLDLMNRGPENVKLRKYGHVYGVLRVLDDNHPSLALTERLLSPRNLRGKKMVVLVRDPRDILVSMYFSFGFSHAASPNPGIRRYQEERRARIQAMTIDEYALHTAASLREKFGLLARLIESPVVKDCLLLKYEDLIFRFEDFYKDFSGFVELEDEVKNELYRRTRPPKDEDSTRHRRKGTPGDHKEKLQPETVQKLDGILEPALKYFGYPLES